MKRFRSSSNLAALTVQCLNCHLNTIPFRLKGPRVYLSEVMGPADLLKSPSLPYSRPQVLALLPGRCILVQAPGFLSLERYGHLLLPHPSESGEPLAALTDKETMMHGLNETHGGHGFPISCLEGPVHTTQMCQGVTPAGTNTKQRYEIRRSHQRNPLPFFLLGGLFKIVVAFNDIQ